MRDLEFERLAIDAYRRFRFDPLEPASPIRLAQHLLGHDEPIEWVPWLINRNAALFEFEGRRRVGIRRGIALADALFGVSRELARVILGAHHLPVSERECDYLGAALMAPAPAVRALEPLVGRGASSILASSAAMTHTWAMLRIGEVLDRPIVTVRFGANPLIRYRGGAEQLPLFKNDETVFAAARGDVRMLGVRKVMLADETTPRAALLVA